MILDSSAVAAVTFQEPGFESIVAKLTAAPTVSMGAPTLVETGLSSRLDCASTLAGFSPA